ncbi:hypothetical protein NXS08_06665 [Gleimia sp. 6138-11-ORH1]|uniref:murein biosynthesis integral membrane protein MurJ n=1 Tax=Gleimia sp. 6138-11-ORH1 TaxID=2973937 RepID=UPI00216A88C6|nr:lipid II flippase MurJ [Gleimia sp. 6138-11-ORH1]MCS4485145.1 hypothetical protein [Gleimia sp. 6138-11-ORH1]
MSKETAVKAEAKPIGDPIKGSVLKSSAVMASGTLVSRILGFIRWSLLIAAIGGVAANDAFQVANSLPNTVYNLLAAGVLNAILVPQIVRAFKTTSGSDYVNRLITLAGTILFGMTLLTLVGASVLVNIFTVEMPPAWKSLAVVFSIWCLPQIFFYGLYNLLGETLNARGIFGPYTWVPVVNNIIGIAGLIAFIMVYGTASNVDDPSIWTFERTALLAGPATLGVIVQALLLFIPLHRAGVKIRPDFKFRGAGLRSASKIAIWMFAVLIVNQLSIISTTNIAAAANNWREITGLYAPSITAVNLTFMIYMMPQSIITTSIAIAVFTRIASATADNDYLQVSKDFHFGVRITTVLNLWAAAILGAGAIPIFQALAPRVGEEQVYGTALALVVMLPGLGVAAISMFSTRVFFALEDGKPILLSVLFPTVAFVITSWILKGFLPGYLWVTGTLAAEAVMRLAVAWLSLKFVAARIPRVNKPAIILETALYFVLSLISGFLAYSLLRLVNPYAPGSAYSVQLLGAAWRGILVVLCVTIIYVILMAIFDRRSFNAILDAVGNRIPSVKKFGEKLPQVNLIKTTEPAAEPADEDFFTPGNDPQEPIWFSDKLADRSKFATAKVAPASLEKDAEETPFASKFMSGLIDQLYRVAVVFQPAPYKHADPVSSLPEFGTASEFTPATESVDTDTAALQLAPVIDEETEPEVSSPADLEETMVIGHLPFKGSKTTVPKASEVSSAAAEVAEEAAEEVADDASPSVLARAKTTGAALAAYLTPALSKLKDSASSTLKGSRSKTGDEQPSSEINEKNGIMIETLHRGTRAISQSFESVRQTVDDFQTGKRVDPTKPTIVIFVVLTILALLFALGTLGLLPGLSRAAEAPQTSGVSASQSSVSTGLTPQTDWYTGT